jgi:hypothetical protein
MAGQLTTKLLIMLEGLARIGRLAPLIRELRKSRWRKLKLKQPDTRIFSPHAVPTPCVTSGRYWYLFKRLTTLSAGQSYRFEHVAILPF